MKVKALVLSIGFLISLILGWFIIGLILAGSIKRYLYGYEFVTDKFTSFIGIIMIGILLISLIVGMAIGYIAGVYKK